MSAPPPAPAARGAWSDLGEGVRVRQSAAFRMNSVVLLDPGHTWVIDPGVLPEELDDIALVVQRVQPENLTLCLTHAHWDHVLGRPWFPSARVLAHDRFAAELRPRAAHVEAEIVKLCTAHGTVWTRGFAAFAPDDAASGQRFMKTEPWMIVLRDAPGHAASQLTLHLPEQRLLIAADMLSDVEIPALADAPEVYRQTLDPLRTLAEHGAIETLVPGHGAIARGRDAVLERFRHDLDYLDTLSRAVAEARAAGLGVEATVERLADMRFTGKGDASWDTAPSHRANIGHAYRAASAPARARRPAAR